MVTDECDHQILFGNEKAATQSKAGAALKYIAAQLPNAETAVAVRIAELCAEIKQREHRVQGVARGQLAQPLLHERA